MYNTSILSHVPSLQLKCFLAHCITAAVVADCIAACCDRRNESKRKKSEKKTHSLSLTTFMLGASTERDNSSISSSVGYGCFSNA